MTEAARPLLTALSPRRIGEQCRATGLGIVNNTHRWGKAELAGWLSGPYRRATLYAASAKAADSQVLKRGVTRPYQPLPATKAEVPSGQVEALLEQLREEIVCLFRGAPLSKIESFSNVCHAHGFVLHQVTDAGESLYLPVDQPRMRLLERVVSLFAADALTCLETYATVRICDRCSAMTFGACTHAPSGWQSRGAPRIRRED